MELQLNTSNFVKAIHRSQHCQRNWDLSKEIPRDSMEVIVTAATQCPSKQNVAFYKAHFITNREIIEKIHDATKGFALTYEPLNYVTNSQVLANLLIVFELNDYLDHANLDIQRNDELKEHKEGQLSDVSKEVLRRDAEMAIGIAAGYVNVTANLLGYSTGCCACFSPDDVKAILGLENDPILLMGVGFKAEGLNRRIHHKDHNVVFPTRPKQKIPTSFIK